MAVDLDLARAEEVVDGFEGTGHVAVAADLGDLSGHAALIARARDGSAASTCWPIWLRCCVDGQAWMRSPRPTGTSSTTST